MPSAIQKAASKTVRRQENEFTHFMRRIGCRLPGFCCPLCLWTLTILGWFTFPLTGRAGAPNPIPSGGAGQPPQDFLVANWQAEDGLPQNSVTALAQTKDGYIWVGTINGLALFDGVRFTVFNVLNTPTLPGNTIVGLFEAYDGTLLIVTDGGGIATFRKGRFQRIQDPLGEHEKLMACLNTRSGGSILLANSGLLWRWQEGRLTPLVTRRHRISVNPKSLCEDAQGTLWMIEDNGRPLRLAGDTLTPEPLTGSMTNANCHALMKDAGGRIWLGTSRGLAQLRDGKFVPVSLPEVAVPFPITELFPSRDGGFWVRSNFRVQKFRAGHWVGTPCQITGVRTSCFCLGEDRWGRLCLGSNAEGLLRVAEDGTLIQQDRNNGLPGNSVFCYLQDSENDEWFGLEDAGLAKLLPRWFNPLLDPQDDQQAPALSVFQDHQGAIWAGTSEGGIYRVQAGRVTHYTSADLPLTHIWSIGEDHQSRLWFGTTQQGLFEFKDGHFTQKFDATQVSVRVNALLEDSRGRLWLGCQSGLQYLQHGKLVPIPLPTNAVYEVCAIAEDHEGRIWAGTKNSGLVCWEYGHLSYYTQTNGLPMNSIWALHVDAQDTLWIGTFGGGLSRLREGKFVNYSKRTGLADDTISCILEDRAGWFWFCSPHGVFRVSGKDLKSFAEGKATTIFCINYGRTDGLPSSECTGGYQPAGWRTSDGRLLFPTLKGVAVVRPETLTFNSHPPPVEIEDAILGQTGRRIVLTTDASGEAKPVNNSPTNQSDATGELIIPPGESRLEIRYTALSFPAPDKVRFRYRLEGLDADWVQAGSRRSVEYSHLRPGHYRFHVTASNNDGVWNRSGASLAIIVEPYFWQTRLFLLAVIVMVATGLLLLVSRYERNQARRKLERLEQLTAIERERTRIANDIHDELGANLTRMTLLSERVEADKDQPMVVETHSRKIAANARETLRSLDEIVWAINPRNDTLDSFLQYVSHYADEFFDDSEMTYRLKIPTFIPPVPLRAEMRHGLFLVVKEALNNVLKHAHATQVSISVKLEHQNLEIIVEDNGRGAKTVESAGSKKRNGLANMRQRMETLHGSFHFDIRPGSGTRVQLNIELEPPT